MPRLAGINRRSSIDNDPGMRLLLKVATADEAPAIANLRNIAAAGLTSAYGSGAWSGQSTARGVLFDMRRGSVYVARRERKLVASLILSTRKPWTIDVRHFTAVRKALYLTAMVVDPVCQLTGIGRRCLEDAQTIASGWPADAIRLDAWDAQAGAGDFYRRCGYREVARATCREAPLIYFEQMIGNLGM